jgi:hypothetical protein
VELVTFQQQQLLGRWRRFVGRHAPGRMIDSR